MNAAELENVCKMSECLHKLMCLWENISAKGWNFMHFRGQSHLTLYCLNLTEAHSSAFTATLGQECSHHSKKEHISSAQIFTILMKSRGLYLHHQSNHRVDHQRIIWSSTDTYPQKNEKCLVENEHAASAYPYTDLNYYLPHDVRTKIKDQINVT